uniref:Uncharacterized protein n=2 Tax=Oryza TaxID=4527 RepID=A0A0D3HD19_9ORYZ
MVPVAKAKEVTMMTLIGGDGVAWQATRKEGTMAGRLSEEEVMGQMWHGIVACPLVHEGGGWRWRKKPSSSSPHGGWWRLRPVTELELTHEGK